MAAPTRKPKPTNAPPRIASDAGSGAIVGSGLSKLASSTFPWVAVNVTVVLVVEKRDVAQAGCRSDQHRAA